MCKPIFRQSPTKDRRRPIHLPSVGVCRGYKKKGLKELNPTIWFILIDLLTT